MLWIARSLFRAGSAELVLAVHLPKSRSYMHLDTVITMCDRDLVTLFPQVVVRRADLGDPAGRHPPTTSSSRSSRARCPSSWREALGVAKMRVVETGGDAFEAEREQWDDGNNVVALEPGVVVAYERNVGTNTALRKAGIEVITIEGFELGRGPGRFALHDLSARARPRVLTHSEAARMAFNLRNRSFVKEIDFEPRELRFLLQLSRGAEDREVRGQRSRSGSTARRSR